MAINLRDEAWTYFKDVLRPAFEQNQDEDLDEEESSAVSVLYGVVGSAL